MILTCLDSTLPQDQNTIYHQAIPVVLKYDIVYKSYNVIMTYSIFTQTIDYEEVQFSYYPANFIAVYKDKFILNFYTKDSRKPYSVLTKTAAIDGLGNLLLNEELHYNSNIKNLKIYQTTYTYYNIDSSGFYLQKTFFEEATKIFPIGDSINYNYYFYHDDINNGIIFTTKESKSINKITYNKLLNIYYYDLKTFTMSEPLEVNKYFEYYEPNYINLFDIKEKSAPIILSNQEFD